ncbi:extracellular solute-binding protein [Agrobacterium vitis]|uniref:ABC transporter substrate-binding protein n=1 Tax=Rhizobium/Agrobacterium group TaxID=227290 RepID=UPI0012E78A53|nr:sugar ABC transporter substrate-binding protein [Allorhizobium ampelinum]MVA45874.1 extracellular solute-binding protein [Agrobacterium vitis]
MSIRIRIAMAMAAATSMVLATMTPAMAKDKLRVTVAYYSAATEPYFKKQAERFMASHPDIDVQVQVVNWDNLQQKLTTDIASGVNPDIALIGTRWLVDFVKQDLVEPLDPLANGEFKDRFIGTFLSPGEIDGALYGLPIAASARAMFYNKDLFAKAGISGPPKTWDDVISASEKLVSVGAYGYGIQGKEIDTDVYFYFPLWTNGGDIVGKDGKLALNSDAGVRAATTYKTLIDKGLTQPGVTGYSREGVQDLFKQGRLGMVLSLPFLSGQIQKEAPNIKYGIAPIPEGTNAATYAVTDSIVMFKNTRHKQAAWAFLDQLFSQDARIEFTKGEGFLPTTKSEAEDPFFQNNADLKAFVDLLPNAKFAPLIANWEGVSTAVIRNLQLLYLGEKSPKEAMDAANAEAAQAMQQ